MFYHGARLNVTCNQKFKILACRLSIIKDISGLNYSSVTLTKATLLHNFTLD